MGLIFHVKRHQCIKFHSTVLNCILLDIIQRLSADWRASAAECIMTWSHKLQGESLAGNDGSDRF